MKPFRDIVLSSYLEQQLGKLKNEIDGFSDDIVLANDLMLLADNCYEKYRIEPVSISSEDVSQRKLSKIKMTIYCDDWHREEGTMKVDGLRLSFYYPFLGDEFLFKCKANTFSVSGYPEIELTNRCVVLSQEIRETQISDASAERFKEGMPDSLKQIQRGIEYANNDVLAYNQTLYDTALNLLNQRKDRIESIIGFAKQLNISINKTEYADQYISVPRKINPIKTKRPHESSSVISDKDYNDILGVIRNICATLEQMPQTYKSMKEEDLRNVLLAPLNGSFNGAAKGECFRNHGKTDILIEAENRAAFVAECKMWSGVNAIPKAIGQLDSYLTWRDCKTALLFFSRKVNFLEAIGKMKLASQEIAAPGTYRQINDNEIEIKIASRSNIGQYVTIRLMIFNLYANQGITDENFKN